MRAFPCERRRRLRTVIACALVLAATLAHGPPSPVVARGEDACPEPNDDVQAACYLGPNTEAVGFLSRADDVDAYRIEVLDFDVGVRVELAERPHPYTVELANWNGDVVARSTTAVGGAEMVQATVRVPGAYYVRVRSPSGAFSDTEPYVIFRSLAYPGASVPSVLYSSEFRAGGTTGFAGATDVADHSEANGRYAVAMRTAGTPADPSIAWAAWGPRVVDFTLTVDARVASGTEAGFQVYVRRVDDDYSYVVTVDARNGRVMLSKLTGAAPTGTAWVRSAAIDTRGGVNRCVVRASGEHLRVNVNGAELIRATDATFGTGRFGFGAITWGAPPVVAFDNVLVTTPTEG